MGQVTGMRGPVCIAVAVQGPAAFLIRPGMHWTHDRGIVGQVIVVAAETDTVVVDLTPGNSGDGVRIRNRIIAGEVGITGSISVLLDDHGIAGPSHVTFLATQLGRNIQTGC